MKTRRHQRVQVCGECRKRVVSLERIQWEWSGWEEDSALCTVCAQASRDFLAKLKEADKVRSPRGPRWRKGRLFNTNGKRGAIMGRHLGPEPRSVLGLQARKSGRPISKQSARRSIRYGLDR